MLDLYNVCRIKWVGFFFDFVHLKKWESRLFLNILSKWNEWLCWKCRKTETNNGVFRWNRERLSGDLAKWSICYRVCVVAEMLPMWPPIGCMTTTRLCTRLTNITRNKLLKHTHTMNCSNYAPMYLSTRNFFFYFQNNGIPLVMTNLTHRLSMYTNRLRSQILCAQFKK